MRVSVFVEVRGRLDARAGGESVGAAVRLGYGDVALPEAVVVVEVHLEEVGELQG